MQAVTLELKQEAIMGRGEETGLTATLVGWITRVFGCWHRDLSRPFTLRAESYRACLECGAHRRFNPQTWELTGQFYYESNASASELYRYTSAPLRVAPAVARRNRQPVLRAA